MASLQFALVLVLGVVSQSLAMDVATCEVYVDVAYPDGSAPTVDCYDTCEQGLWFEGVAYQRVSRLSVEYGLMVQINYQNGALVGCTTVPYESDEETAAKIEEVQECMGIEEQAIPTVAPTVTPAPITTAAPGTTAAPATTAAPTTAAPTTAAPTTAAPTTAAPTTAAPTTAAPTTAAPTTEAPTTAAPTTAAAPPCPEGFTELLGNCYLVSADALTRGEALTFCKENGATLAFIESRAEQDAVQAILTTHTYIGINDIKSEGVFTSLLGEPVQFTNWNDGEPNGATAENCVAMRENKGYGWNDVPCSKAFVALCKVAATY